MSQGRSNICPWSSFARYRQAYLGIRRNIGSRKQILNGIEILLVAPLHRHPQIIIHLQAIQGLDHQIAPHIVVEPNIGDVLIDAREHHLSELLTDALEVLMVQLFRDLQAVPNRVELQLHEGIEE